MYLTKTHNGYIPSDDTSYEQSKKIKVGDEVKASKPRNAKFHRKAFVLLNLGHDNQDIYDQFEVYRKVITIRAGYYDEAPTKNGEIYYIYNSIITYLLTISWSPIP